MSRLWQREVLLGRESRRRQVWNSKRSGALYSVEDPTGPNFGHNRPSRYWVRNPHSAFAAVRNNHSGALKTTPVPFSIEEGFNVKQSESIRRGCAKVRLARAEALPKLSDEARKEAKQAMAIRRSRLRDRRNQNGKPGDRTKQGKTRTERKRETGDAERPTWEDLETIVNAPTLAGVSGEWVQPHF
jgi:hypothetical protein